MKKEKIIESKPPENKEMYQYDLELCTDVPPCWRFREESIPKCVNCPHLVKEKSSHDNH